MSDASTRFDRLFLGGLLLVMVLSGFALRGLTGPIDLTGSWDELTYHYPSALHLAELPFPDSLRDYPSATGPVAYLAVQAAQVAHMDLVAVRWLTLLATFLLGFFIYRLLVDRAKLDRSASALFTATALLSPYVLGGTFLFMTDNYAWLFVIAWAYFLTGFLEADDIRQLAASILFLSLAICTRQTTAWLVPLSGWAAWRSPKHRALGLTATAVACVPLAMLVILWDGPTPPSALGRHTGIGGSYLRAATMGLTTLGFFSLFFIPWAAVREAWRNPTRNRVLSIGAVVSLALLLAAPLAGDSPNAPRNPVHVDGYLLKFLDHGPRMMGAYLLYWPFLFLGLAVLWIAYSQKATFTVACLAATIAVHLSNKIVYERYFELLVLVGLAAIFGAGWRETRWRILTLCALFLCHPFFRHRVSPTPFAGLDTSMYSSERARDIRARFVP